MSTPDILIALPVYRGAAVLPETLRSICAQTYRGWRAIVSVDPSDDESTAVCRSMVGGDDRFVIIDQPTRLGWPGNLNWILTRCELPFVCYWQQDDLASTEYLASLRDQLMRHPRAVIAYTQVQWFGSRIERDASPSSFMPAGLPARQQALAHALERIERINYEPLRGLIRSSALPARAAPIPPSRERPTHQEFVFLAELATRGEFHRVDAALYFKRAHDDNTFGAWLAEPASTRWREWVAMGAGMVNVVLPFADPTQRWAVVATVLDRLHIERPGRGFWAPAQQTPDAVDDTAELLTRLAGLDLADLESSLTAGSAFDRPVHPWVTASLERERRRQAVLTQLAAELDEHSSLELHASDQRAAACFSDWHLPDDFGRWSRGNTATLRLPSWTGRLQVTIDTAVFSPAGPVGVEGWFGDRHVMSCRVEGHAVLEFELERSHDDPIWPALQLDLPDAVSPSSMSMSIDDRVLCLNPRLLRFERC